MDRMRSILGLLLILALLLSGCGIPVRQDVSSAGTETLSAGTAPEEAVTAETETETTETETETETAEAETETETTGSETVTVLPEPEEKFVFNPHLYSPLLSKYYSQEWWDSLYHLFDALREGRDTFECVSQEAYDWCMDSVTLADLFPPACMVVSGKSTDGSVPFENGVGRIYYQIPAEEYVTRQKEFETLIEGILNRVLEPDDTDFEKAFKLFAYMASEYTYGEISYEQEGYTYATLRCRQGVCENISGVYVYLLLQVGVDAMNIGCFAEDIQHSWTYMILDGEGYHTDATWALHGEGEPLYLTFFLNSENGRNEYGIPTDDMTAGMVPRFWLKFTDTVLPATSEKYACLRESVFLSLDEENKILYYEDASGANQELRYE